MCVTASQPLISAVRAFFCWRVRYVISAVESAVRSSVEFRVRFALRVLCTKAISEVRFAVSLSNTSAVRSSIVLKSAVRIHHKFLSTCRGEIQIPLRQCVDKFYSILLPSYQ